MERRKKAVETESKSKEKILVIAFFLLIFSLPAVHALKITPTHIVPTFTAGTATVTFTLENNLDENITVDILKEGNLAVYFIASITIPANISKELSVAIIEPDETGNYYALLKADNETALILYGKLPAPIIYSTSISKETSIALNQTITFTFIGGIPMIDVFPSKGSSITFTKDGEIITYLITFTEVGDYELVVRHIDTKTISLDVDERYTLYVGKPPECPPCPENGVCPGNITNVTNITFPQITLLVRKPTGEMVTFADIYLGAKHYKMGSAPLILIPEEDVQLDIQIPNISTICPSAPSEPTEIPSAVDIGVMGIIVIIVLVVLMLVYVFFGKKERRKKPSKPEKREGVPITTEESENLREVLGG